MDDKSIIGQKSFLIPLEESDMELISTWAYDPLVRKNYYNYASIQESNLKKIINNPEENLNTYVINTMDNVAIGKLSLEIMDDSSANIDMVIGEKIYTGKGYGKDALKAAIKYCFEELNLDSVRMIIKEDNMRAEYCCWSCGLREDKYYIPDDKMSHTSRMVIFKRDYIGY